MSHCIMKFYNHVLYNVHDQNKENKLKEKVKSIKTKKGKLNEMQKKRETNSITLLPSGLTPCVANKMGYYSLTQIARVISFTRKRGISRLLYSSPPIIQEYNTLSFSYNTQVAEM